MTAFAALAALACAAAVLVGWPEGVDGRLAAAPPSVRRRLARPPVWVPLVLVVALFGVVGALLDGVRGGVLGWSAGMAAAVVSWTALRTRASRLRAGARDEVARGCGELAALLRAGHAPLRALRLVAQDAPVFAEAAAQQRVGGEVAAVLRQGASRPGCEGLTAVAAAWQVTERTGAAMTASLDDLAAHLHAEREVGRTVTTELAATRLTGRLLGLLPLVGLALGYLIGGDPLAYLTASAPGLVCLGVGTGLAVAGLVWSETLADRAGRLR